MKSPGTATYKAAFSRVRDVVAQADPEGLLGGGAPPDEYDDLVADLTRRLLGGENMSAESLFGSWTSWRGEMTREAVADRLTALQTEMVK